MRENELAILRENLPKVPGILGREKYFHSAVLVPLVLLDRQYHFLFEKRAQNIRQEGEVCFPGGIHDPALDLDFAQTAIRETVEELGIKETRIRIEGRLDTLVTPFGAIVEPFIATLELKNLDELRVNREEVAEVFCLPVSYFEENNPEEFLIRMEMHPSNVGKSGETIVLLPAEELGFPPKYWQAWGGMKHKVYVYRTEPVPIWGMTASLVRDVVKYLR